VSRDHVHKAVAVRLHRREPPRTAGSNPGSKLNATEPSSDQLQPLARRSRPVQPDPSGWGPGGRRFNPVSPTRSSCRLRCSCWQVVASRGSSRRLRPPTAAATIAAKTQSKPSSEPDGSGTATATGAGSCPITASRVSGERRSCEPTPARADPGTALCGRVERNPTARSRGGRPLVTQLQ